MGLAGAPNRKRAVVTGGLGFIGAHVAERLVAEGYRVLVIDAPPEDSAGGLGAAGDMGAARGIGDVALVDVATADAQRVVEAFRPALVVHAAAQTSVAQSVADPVGDTVTNVTGTVHMLEGARRVGAAGFIYLSSAAIYGEAIATPIDEGHPTQPLSPYGISKLAATRYVQHYRATGRLATAALIPANVYGPGQSAVAEGGPVVAAFVRAAALGEPLQIAGDGEQTRDLLYVDDMVQAIWQVWHRLAAGSSSAVREVAATQGPKAEDSTSAPRSCSTALFSPGSDATFNISSGRETSINQLAATVERAAGRPLTCLRLPARPGDIDRSCLSSQRAERVLGWRARVDLGEGLARTLAWWRNLLPAEGASSG